jgi:hypothetical protein
MNALIATPGFHPEITPEQYFAEPCPAPALTNSGIKTLLGRCPAAFYHDHPALGGAERSKSTAAQNRGNLVHRLALGKGSDYAVSPYDEFRTAEAKAWKAGTEAAGLMPVKRKDLDVAEAMASVIRERIVEACDGEAYETEVVFAWQETMNTGTVWCRGMLDVWCPSLQLALDVKTCRDASDAAIERAFADGYAGQDAWYRRGINAITKDAGRARFGFLFVESDEPHLFRRCNSTEGFRYAAQKQAERALAIFADCLSSGQWPGYDPLAVVPPSWLLNRWDAAEFLDLAA